MSDSARLCTLLRYGRDIDSHEQHDDDPRVHDDHDAGDHDDHPADDDDRAEEPRVGGRTASGAGKPSPIKFWSRDMFVTP